MILDLNNVTKEYVRGGKTFRAVDEVCLQIDAGDFVHIIGRSGSGKSTLLNMVSGLLTPTGGSIRLAGEEITEKKDAEMSKFRNFNIGFVPQGADLLYNLNVFDNISLPYFLYKREGDPMGRAAYLIEMLGLEDMRDAYPAELSGGELRRVLIARGLMNDPKILIADEPTADLDIENTEAVMEIFQKINRDGTTLLIVTHELDTLAYGKTVYTMSAGRLTEGTHLKSTQE
ncbi:MAG: ABC transporter ATP-binding protein [Eubacteriales bacterium]|nr:ABC transporter ATP-binding protein [Eubacteriales bacterium]